MSLLYKNLNFNHEECVFITKPPNLGSQDITVSAMRGARCNLPVKVCHSSRMAFPKEVLGVCPHRVTSVSIRFNPTFCETISRLLTRY